MSVSFTWHRFLITWCCIITAIILKRKLLHICAHPPCTPHVIKVWKLRLRTVLQLLRFEKGSAKFNPPTSALINNTAWAYKFEWNDTTKFSWRGERKFVNKADTKTSIHYLSVDVRLCLTNLPKWRINDFFVKSQK